MELERKYAEFAAEKAIELIGIDSPSGFTEKAAKWVCGISCLGKFTPAPLCKTAFSQFLTIFPLK